MKVPPPIRHRCFCCVGRTQHHSGVCVQCGANGYLLEQYEPITPEDIESHRSIILRGPSCKLTAQEKQEALAFIAAGEPCNYQPRGDDAQTTNE